jgi:phosphohistidine phosphatase
MSKTLLLLRHGKSDWSADSGVDHERPLNPRGVKAAKAIGRFLAETGHVPPYAITSTAVRAATTLALAARSGEWDTAIVPDRRLYATDPERMIGFLQELPAEQDRVLLVGHEPTWSELLSLLVGGGVFCFPTAALARIDLAVSAWSGVRPGTGELVWLLPPRLLTDRS